MIPVCKWYNIYSQQNNIRLTAKKDYLSFVYKLYIQMILRRFGNKKSCTFGLPIVMNKYISLQCIILENKYRSISAIV